MKKSSRLTTTVPWALVVLLGAFCILLLARPGGEAPSSEPDRRVPILKRPLFASSQQGKSGSPLVQPEDATPAQQFAAALARSDGKVRSTLLLGAVSKLVAADPFEALTLVEAKLEGAERLAAIRTGLREWINHNPKAAGHWLLRMSQDPAFESTLVGFVTDWAALAPASAAAWVSALPRNEAYASAADALAREWAKQNALAAYEWSLEHYASTEEGDPFQRALAALTVGDPQLALAVLEIAPVDLLYRGHAQLAAAWADTDLPAAAHWAAGLADGREKSAAVTSVVNAWSQESPSAAAEYLLSLDDFSAQGNAVAMLVNNWAMSDVVKASEWLAGLPGSSMRDQAISGFTYSLAFTDPASAATWGMDIGDPALRNARVEELLIDWHDRDPQAAKKWIAETQALPEQIRKNVIEP